MKEIPKAYNPGDYEDAIYKNWEEKGLFNPDTIKSKGESFSIVLPPPNVTGVLHLGHASMLAIEDLMIRYKRMKGFDTVWIPGTDHAAIATQNVVEKRLAKKKITRQSLGREKFLGEVDKFVNQSKDTIRHQVRKMGASLDWSREAYTLDETRSRAVRKVFTMMYDDGLIYRGYRIVNWCPRCHSTLADDEVDHKEAGAKMYYFKYDKDFPFTIATTRPETKLGDTAVAVNKKDKRYKKFIGQTLKANFVGQPLELKIIADEAVDPEYGTGALGVTPAHSLIDYEMAQKNGLPIIKVIDEDGRITKEAKAYQGLAVEEAREKVVRQLEKQGLLEKVEEVNHNLSLCYRCDAVIEPLPSDQWFVDVNKKVDRLGMSLKEKSLEVVKDGSIKFIPKRFEKIYHNWLDNLHDWCISRQIWFGHQIPVWYKKSESRNQPFRSDAGQESEKQEIYVGEDAPQEAGWIQDGDTLDTWFSSGLWTFSTLLKQDFKTFEKKDNPELRRFHPTAVLETGYDILFFWIARMVLMTTYVMGEVPFEKVYLHGIIRDKEGKKMSKSRPETALDPLVVGEKYGYDAVRLSLLIGSTPGNDLRLFDEKIAGYRNFVNKLWNVSRYILMNVTKIDADLNGLTLTLADKWILSKINRLNKSVTKQLDSYNFSQAGQELYDFTWNELADWYLEISKVEKNKDEIFIYLLKNLLRMWHPFTPFVTEAIWSYLTPDKGLIVSDWPGVDKKLIDSEEEEEFEIVQQMVTKIRNLRSEYKVEAGKKVKVLFKTKNKKLIEEQKEVIMSLARLEGLNFVESKPEKSAGAVVDRTEIYLPLADLIDLDQEKVRLKKEIDNVSKYIESLEKKLGNKQFVANAPDEVVEIEKNKLTEAKNKLDKFKNQTQFL